MAKTPKKQVAGHYAKAVPTNASGVLIYIIPAGYFNAVPIVTCQPLVPSATRDHVFTLTGVTLNADKTVTVTGFVRRSRLNPAVISLLSTLANYDPFEALPTQVNVHLIAQEAD